MMKWQKPFFEKALWPRAKVKEQILPNLAERFGVSTRYIQKAVRNVDPLRRQEMESAASACAEGLREVQRLDRLGIMNKTLAEAYADQAYAKAGNLPSVDAIAERIPNKKRTRTKVRGALE